MKNKKHDHAAYVHSAYVTTFYPDQGGFEDYATTFHRNEKESRKIWREHPPVSFVDHQTKISLSTCINRYDLNSI